MRKKLSTLLVLALMLMCTPIRVYAGTDPLSSTHNFTVDSDIIKMIIMALIVVILYFFSTQIQRLLANVMQKASKKVGMYSTSKEYYLQRYTYQHQGSPLTALYNFVNEQLIALGYKRLGITVVGYLIFWAVVAAVISAILTIIAQLGLAMYPFLTIIVFICTLVMTRVSVSERMEKRESDIMNAIDLIVPEIGNGVKNAIVTYLDNFAPSVKEDFQAFVSNIQERGYTFEDAMYILSDNLGLVFKDFAQKAIYYEAIGEKEMLDIFSDITETNRLRRQLRSENEAAFLGLKSTFLVSTVLVVGYFIFLMLTDDFSRTFFLTSIPGKMLLLVIVLVIFSVLAYISTIKSKAI